MIIPAAPEHLEAWARLRHALWPDEPLEKRRAECHETLAADGADRVAFVALARNGAVIGFAEGSLRHDYVNGCDTSPVAFLEGIHVDPAHRASGVGRTLVAAVEAWGAGLGCTELGSDALLENLASHAFHAAVGFEETERVVCFRKLLNPSRP